MRKVAGDVEVARSVARHIDKAHHAPVSGKENNHSRELGADCREQVHKRSEKVTDGYALQDSKQTLMRQAEGWIDIDQKSEHIQDKRASQYPQQEISPVTAAFEPLTERQGNRDAHDPKKGREDGVRKRPTVPGCVL